MPLLRIFMIAVSLLAIVPQAFASDVMDIVFAARNGGSIIFSHQKHLASRAINDNCNICHEKIYRTKSKRPVTMAEMEKGRSCGACHEGRSAFPLAECSGCHMAGNVLMKVTGAGPVTFSHAFHTGLYRCADCHPKVFRLGYTRPRATMLDMDQGKSCGACHNDYTAFTTREN
jgi:c(7)-type cytochrome triheme protein